VLQSEAGGKEAGDRCQLSQQEVVFRLRQDAQGKRLIVQVPKGKVHQFTAIEAANQQKEFNYHSKPFIRFPESDRKLPSVRTSPQLKLITRVEFLRS
jgi:hypothetical protein